MTYNVGIRVEADKFPAIAEAGVGVVVRVVGMVSVAGLAPGGRALGQGVTHSDQQHNQLQHLEACNWVIYLALVGLPMCQME